MSLVRENITSLYAQIAQSLRDEIQRGIYEPSGKLPSEPELCRRFDVSRVTVRQALAQLTETGEVERKQGKGTYVAGRQVRHELDALRSFHESLLLQGLQARMQLLTKTRVARPAELADLFPAATQQVLQLERLHWVDDEPIALGRSYLRAELDAFAWEDIENRPAYSLLEASTGLAVVRADLTIRAQPATAELAATLQINPGSALLVLGRSSWLADGSGCDHSTFYIRPERYEFALSSVFSRGVSGGR